MTRSSCFGALACVALTVTLSLVGCGGAGDALPVSGSGGSGAPGGGSGGTGGSRPSNGSGGSNGGSVDAGSGGGRDAGSGGGRDAGSGGGRDAGGRPDGRPGRDAGGGNADAGGAGAIPNCSPGARCRPGNPQPTCMDMCPGGGQRACACTALGVVRCDACPRADAGGGGGGNDAGGDGGLGLGACPAGAADGVACMPNGTACSSPCPTGNRREACACRNGMWACFGMCQ